MAEALNGEDGYFGTFFTPCTILYRFYTVLSCCAPLKIIVNVYYFAYLTVAGIFTGKRVVETGRYDGFVSFDRTFFGLILPGTSFYHLLDSSYIAIGNFDQQSGILINGYLRELYFRPLPPLQSPVHLSRGPSVLCIGEYCAFLGSTAGFALNTLLGCFKFVIFLPTRGFVFNAVDKCAPNLRRMQ